MTNLEIVQNEYNNPRSEEQNDKKYYEKTPEKLLFTSESLFTSSFMEEIAVILQDGDDFRRKSAIDKRELVDQLDSLLERETLWKDLVKGSKYDPTKIKEIFEEGFNQFTSIFNRQFFPQLGEHKKNVINKYGSSKAILFYSGLINHLVTAEINIFNTHKRVSITNEQLQKLSKEIQPGFIFQELVKISMKKAYDTNINIQNSNNKRFHSEILDTRFLEAKRSDLQYAVRRYLAMYLTNQVITFLGEEGFLKNRGITYRIDCLKFMDSHYRHELKYMLDDKKYSWFLEADTLTMMFLDMFETTEVIKDVTTTSTKKKKNRIYIFNHKLDNSISFSHHLPRITVPLKGETLDGIEEWISPMKKGRSTAQASNEAIKALNIAQKKEFIINEDFIKILKAKDLEEQSSEFPTKKAFETQREDYLAWKHSSWSNILSKTLYTVTDRFVKSATDKDVETRKHIAIVRMCKLTRAECYANMATNQIRDKLLVMKSSRQLLMTSLDISVLYQNFPLYYSTLLDFRLRMYPLQYLLSRTTGYLKNLLKESKSRKLTTVGIGHMIEAYYSTSPSQRYEFKKKGKKKEMLKFFLENRLCDLENQVVYFKLLEHEIFKIANGHTKTALPLEIDQVGSGPTLIALLTGNKALAQKCNLLEGPFQCIYTYLLSKTKDFICHYDNDILKKAPKSFNLLTTDRKAAKYAIMCFFYNEKHLSRTNRWKEQFEELHGISVDNGEYALLSKFSIDFPLFLDFVFPKLLDQLNLLNEAMQVLTGQGQPVKIKTLDGSIITWDFDHVTHLKKNYYNPSTGTHDQYRLNISVKSPTKQTTRNRTRQHTTGFRPNLIHSIDGAIMRIFITKFYEQTGRRINHLHDCVMVHPNDVDTFFKIVSEVYTDRTMRTLASDLVFSVFKENTVSDAKQRLIEIENKFLTNMDDFTLTSTTFDPKKCYRYEGTKDNLPE